jgi:hypothetical protein
MKLNPSGFNLNFDEFFDVGRPEGRKTNHVSPITSHQSRLTSHVSPLTSHFSHFETFPGLQDRNLRFTFG